MTKRLPHPGNAPSAIALIAGPALFTAADFFWVGDAEYGLVAGTLLVLGSVAWIVGFAGIAAALRHDAPLIAGWGLLPAVYGAVCGGAAFGLQGVMNAVYGVDHAESLERLGEHPVIANLIFWIGGPAFPLTLLALAVYLLASRRIPRWTGLILAAGAVLFPLARIPRVEVIAVGADILMVIPAVFLATVLVRHGGLPRRADR
ncbi:hypothetical protein Aph02nite_94540 [Actinoplanes philippinensis]|uniref:DUF4386 family protein n=1 Tax=Actinoplanes philippinensis TaxID=35752 RepID=A0A1I2NIB2_9ACTN|nr:hypothetical protein [Actinoplanes philippinensis]GIE83504.1 hypothetical protein Aph02nite_94540 [Actinoplanes philippinensis]SFG01427.1 hypothetical protein SAMN05421541_1441 [Actinoplanes philippinensis]